MTDDTIVACSTAMGRSGIGIVRVSGSLCLALYRSITRQHAARLQPRVATLGPFYCEDQKVIDKPLYLYFPGPHSYTGEDVLELHAHGNPLIIDAMISTLISHGARAALPGEFTQRAYLNGKMNLLEAEAVVDLIDAQTVTQAKAAQASMSGAFADQVYPIQKRLEAIRVQVEASIDFSDQDIAPHKHSRLKTDINSLAQDINALCVSSRRVLRHQDGFSIAIIGPPNSGKSTLLNLLANEDVAIVTDQPGTTRDTLSIQLYHKNALLKLTDTAGIRGTHDKVETIGIEKAIQLASKADLVWCLCPADDEQTHWQSLTPNFDNVLWVQSKADLVAPSNTSSMDVVISAKNNQGINTLLDKSIKKLSPMPPQETFFVRNRHVQALDRAYQQCKTAETVVNSVDLLAENLRLVQNTLAELVGSYTTEDLLGSIFGQFCLGK
ncbi:MAG: tRNA uridine-5-carboxymethylaminomethyl(34) synthesis GTPase MnmE [Pseudomonadota bacterium]|nr:tRNA uridine-5-carboxymethylaminomethyl(34) synthesis GTPase MnmE [Pseudomonadota bacterium]MEC8461172.1 tRNA uridine-5-carboxymethylaminomethyl(34) synthesis GTPase MnmE [Pseudomonadota bacterium]